MLLIGRETSPWEGLGSDGYLSKGEERPLDSMSQGLLTLALEY